MKTWRGPVAGLVFGFWVGMSSAGPFTDVPKDHWAFGAIDRVAATGIMEGDQGRFRGGSPVSRYQVAVVVDRMLRAVRGGGAVPDSAALHDLERLTGEFAEELKLLGTRVETFEAGLGQLRAEVDKLKAGSGNKAAATGLANAFTGLVSVGLMATDDGAPVPPAPAAAGGALTRYTAGTPDQVFFTLPQASIQLNTKVANGVKLMAQWDYRTDALNGAAGVGLDFAYLVVEDLIGGIGARIGGMNGTFVSWELNGPQRTLNYSITPSAVNTFFHRGRIAGIEFSKMKDLSPRELRWRLAIFNGLDTPLPPAAARLGVGAMNDSLWYQGLAASRTYDDRFGYYLDIESPSDPKRHWGWRAGFLDRGGDVTASPGGPAASQDLTAWQVGAWWKADRWRVMGQYMNGDLEFSTAPVGGQADIDAWYLLANYQVNEDDSFTLRYDDWKNEVDTVPAGGTDGSAWTLAYNHKTSATSMLQFEYLMPDEEKIGPVAGNDFDDDLVQLRYKVWF